MDSLVTTITWQSWCPAGRKHHSHSSPHAIAPSTVLPLFRRLASEGAIRQSQKYATSTRQPGPLEFREEEASYDGRWMRCTQFAPTGLERICTEREGSLKVCRRLQRRDVSHVPSRCFVRIIPFLRGNVVFSFTLMGKNQSEQNAIDGCRRGRERSLGMRSNRLRGAPAVRRFVPPEIGFEASNRFPTVRSGLSRNMARDAIFVDPQSTLSS